MYKAEKKMQGNQLSEADEAEFEKVVNKFNSGLYRYNRSLRLETFKEMIKILKDFCNIGAVDDWRRCLACGIFWVDNLLIINVKRLADVMGKSKSNINSSFAKLGYEWENIDDDAAVKVFESVPFLKHRSRETRHWTVRKMKKESRDIFDASEEQGSCCCLQDSEYNIFDSPSDDMEFKLFDSSDSFDDINFSYADFGDNLNFC